MSGKTVEIDCGKDRIPIEVPESAVVAEFRDPEPLASPEQALADALASPHGAPPLAELAKPGMKVAIGFDDPTRPPRPWHVILPAVVELLLACGVARDDIVFICANGNHLSHHNHGVVNHPRTATGDHRRMYFRGLKAEVNAHIERVTGKRIFYVKSRHPSTCDVAVIPAARESERGGSSTLLGSARASDEDT